MARQLACHWREYKDAHRCPARQPLASWRATGEFPEKTRHLAAHPRQLLANWRATGEFDSKAADSAEFDQP